jgi:hypothetical protein
MLRSKCGLSISMGEKEPNKEIIRQGELYFLSYAGNEEVFSGYGLTTQMGSKASLVGLLMVDRPNLVDPAWLSQVEERFGGYQLVTMASSGERGILCRMRIEPNSLPYLRQFSSHQANAIREALKPLLENLPNPIFTLRWDEETRLWQSQMADLNELPQEIWEVFKRTGYGCLAVESDIGVIHVCHAADDDIDGFANKPITYQWQLIKIPTAPLIRLVFTIQDRPDNPYRFESFLNVADDNQVNILSKLANQDRLYMAFFDDALDYRFTKVVPHGIQQWQYLDELVMEAQDYWSKIPPDERDLDQAKNDFMRRYM